MVSPVKTFAIGLGCELRHASRLVYSEGLDLSGGQRDTDRRGLPGLRTRQLPAAGLPRPGPRTRSRRAPQHGVALPGQGSLNRRQRIPPGGRHELGLINWGISRLGARSIRAPQMNLFNVIGQHKLLFLSFLPYSGVLLNWGKLPKRDKELVILRVGHLRNSRIRTAAASPAGQEAGASIRRCRTRSSPDRPPRD